VNKLPELSSSLDSFSSDSTDSTDSEADDQLAPLPTQEPGTPWSFVTATDSHKSKSKRRDNHITPGHLSQLVTCIKEKKELTGPLLRSEVSLHESPHHYEPSPHIPESYDNLRTPRPSSPRPIVHASLRSTVDTTTNSVASQDPHVMTSSDPSTHAVIHGFQIGGAGRSSYKSQSQLATAPQPILKNSLSKGAAGPRKKAGFQLGSSSDEESVTQSLSLKMHSFPGPLQTKKQTSFKEHVEEIEPTVAVSKQPKFHIGHNAEGDDDSEAIESDDDYSDDDDEVSESAIEDDDDEEGWEDDDVEEEQPKQLDFHRVDSKPNLNSRRSLLTEKVHEGQRAAAMQEAAMRLTPPGLQRSRTSTPNGPLVSTSPDDDNVLEYHGSSLTRALPIIQTTTNILPSVAQSPRTNRRNMLANELGTSLRKHLLWERQQRNPVPVPAVLPRRHTTHDLKNTTQFPDAGGGDVVPTIYLDPVAKPGTRNNSWNDYFDNGLGEYHQKGW